MCGDQVFSQWVLSQAVLVFELLHLWLLILLGQSMLQLQKPSPSALRGWLEHLVHKLLTLVADHQQVCAGRECFVSFRRHWSCHPIFMVVSTYSVWGHVCWEDTDCLPSPTTKWFKYHTTTRPKLTN